MADDLTENGTSTYFDSIVKSSNIMAGTLFWTWIPSFVYPRRKPLLAVSTGYFPASKISASGIRYLSGLSYENMFSIFRCSQASIFSNNDLNQFVDWSFIFSTCRFGVCWAGWVPDWIVRLVFWFTLFNLSEISMYCYIKSVQFETTNKKNKWLSVTQDTHIMVLVEERV